MKVLVNTPDTSIIGGVANHFKGLKPHWSLDVKYNFIGGRNGVPGPLILIYDYLKFFIICVSKKYDLILLNPSLGKNAIRRDSLFLKIALFFNIKTIVFFHGWNEEEVKKIENEPTRFVRLFNKADKFIVLASSFRKDLINWGIKKPIFLTKTKVSDEFLNDFSIEKKKWGKNILFLTRIETYKGIFIVIEAFKKIKLTIPSATLTISGEGSKLNEVKEYVINNGIDDVEFTGNISGQELINVYSNASLYILPSYSEGMPTTVLEAMFFGNPVISRPVGGLVDFFQLNEMGYLIDSLDPEDFAKKTIEILNDEESFERIGKYNHQYACKNFLASNIVKELEEVFIA